MPIASENRFGMLVRKLEALGIESSPKGENTFFRHPSGRPAFTLPYVDPGEIVRPIHLLAVRLQLRDTGLIGAEDRIEDLPDPLATRIESFQQYKEQKATRAFK